MATVFEFFFDLWGQSSFFLGTELAILGTELVFWGTEPAVLGTELEILGTELVSQNKYISILSKIVIFLGRGEDRTRF